MVDDDETSCLLSPFVLLPGNGEDACWGNDVFLRPLKLPSQTLRLLSGLNVNDMIAVVPSAALIDASLRNNMLAKINGRVCRVFAAEVLTGDADIVPDTAMLSPMLHAAVVPGDAPHAKVRLCRSSDHTLSMASENRAAKRIVAGVIIPIDFLSDDAPEFADTAKKLLLHHDVCVGDIVAVSPQFWIAIEIVDGTGPVSSDTAFAVRVNGPRSNKIVTQHMREWARLFWGENVQDGVARLAERLELSLQTCNGIIALQGLRNDVGDVLESVLIGRASITIDGRCTTKEAMEAIAKLTLVDSLPGLLVCDGYGGVGDNISELLLQAIYTETTDAYMRANGQGRGDGENALQIVLKCSDARDLAENLAQHLAHEICVEPPDVNERSSIIREVLSRFVLKNRGEKLEAVTETLTRMSVGFSRSEVKGVGNVYVDRGMEGVQKAVKLFGKGQMSVESGKITWEDIGGLEDAKRQINELISVRQKPEDDKRERKKKLNRTGILLYGPPGTGKTLLARAVAGEAGCSFMSVKGPELLDMYVGESEHNVRVVFANAIASAPCVIFFDELDALAPARGRGADSGGVSDRVVSQLMAELDVVNQRGDIFVIGASNRPDLVDESLLRPGRFDKLVYVPMPESREDQEFVLRAQTRKFKFDGPVDMPEILQHAPSPPALSGADLYALSADAWLSAMKRTVGSWNENSEKEDNSGDLTLLGAEKNRASKWKSVDAALDSWPNVELVESDVTENASPSQASMPVVQVSMQDFISAAKKTLPSLSVEESEQYEHLRRRLDSHHIQ